jgi:PAS domain S-box-containing protein
LEKALATAGDGAFAVGPEGRVSLWNRAAERILGWKASEVAERPCCEVFKGVDGNGNRLCYQGCHVMSLVRQGEPVQHFEMETHTKTGKSIWLDISILDVPAVNGERAMTVHLFRDVTSTKRLLQVVRDSLALPPSPNGNDPSPLTRREAEILRLMAGGANTKVLAERLHVSPATIRNHAQNIFAKLNVHSRLEAVAWANQHRLI